MFKLSFDTDNAAFHEEGGSMLVETASILREIADMVEGGMATGRFQTIFDSNGNDIGRWKLAPEEER